MRLRAIIEGSILSAGLVACLAAAFTYATSLKWPAVRASLFDPILWTAAGTSLEIGLVAGVLLVSTTWGLAGLAIYCDLGVPSFLKVVALASALSPDLVHALIWRAFLQPDFGPAWIQSLAADPALQPALLGLVLAVKWAGLIAIGTAATFPENRRSLRACLLLSGTPPTASFLRSVAPHAAKWGALALLVGLLVGLRQHELSDALLGGGAGFAAEGLSQWITKIALAFHDPSRAALELLSVLTAILLVLFALTTPKLMRVR